MSRLPQGHEWCWVCGGEGIQHQSDRDEYMGHVDPHATCAFCQGERHLSRAEQAERFIDVPHVGWSDMAHLAPAWLREEAARVEAAAVEVDAREVA